MYKLRSKLSNRYEYRNCNSLFGANYIAEKILESCPEVEQVELIATETNEIIKIYKRG